MSKLSKIYQAYIAEMRSAIQTSDLLLQKQVDGLSGELKTSGKICEDFIKKVIMNHLPPHLRVTSGYILDLQKKNNDENLSQFDLLIIDNRVPPIYKFNNLDIEVVPVESVCGIFEIKRNINSKNLSKFVSKLHSSVMQYPDLTKTTPYNSNIVNTANMGAALLHPVVGIISLTSDLSKEDLVSSVSNSILDIIWSVDGLGLLPFQQVEGSSNAQFLNFLGRPRNDSFNNITCDEWKKYLDINTSINVYHLANVDKDKPEHILSTIIGWITYMFYRLSGRQGMDIADVINRYYTNNQ